MSYPFFTAADLERWPQLHPPARLSVLGDPVDHSLSPQMHNPALQACGIDAQYVRLHVRPAEFPKTLKAIHALGFIGANCTIPHKFAALEAVDEVEPAARRLGAVNTVIFRPDGTALGRNSDGPGFLRTIHEEFGCSVRDLRILVFGAGGGAGTAVAVQCAMEGCAELILTNRTLEKSQAVHAGLTGLPGHGTSSVVLWTADDIAAVLPRVDLIVNGTSLGMNSSDPPLLPSGLLTSRHMVFDMVYKPLTTPLVDVALRAGARAINGLPMLLWQGVSSFEWWFERPAPVEAMRSGLMAAAGQGTG